MVITNLQLLSFSIPTIYESSMFALILRYYIYVHIYIFRILLILAWVTECFNYENDIIV